MEFVTFDKNGQPHWTLWGRLIGHLYDCWLGYVIFSFWVSVVCVILFRWAWLIWLLGLVFVLFELFWLVGILYCFYIVIRSWAIAAARRQIEREENERYWAREENSETVKTSGGRRAKD
jgi:hypothetical protein